MLPIKLSPTKRSRYNDLYEADAYILRYDLDKSSIDFYEMFVGAFEGTYVWDDIEDFVYEDVSNKETAYAYLGFLDSFGEMVNNFHDNGESDLNRMASEIYQFVRSSYTFQPSFQSIERCRLIFTFTENGQERTVYSQNNLIATALKPLPISFCKDANWGEFLPNFLYRYHPFMVAEDDSGFKFLSEVKGLPTVMRKDNLKFYPTTNTMELYVPVARKHIAVTNVFKGDKSAQDGDADCIAKLKAANSSENLNTVFDSLKRMIEVGGMQIGYTYEIAYSILDFEGNISTKKYYMRIR